MIVCTTNVSMRILQANKGGWRTLWYSCHNNLNERTS